MKRLICVLFVLLFLSYCKKECPLLDPDLLVWQPYEGGDTLKFLDENTSQRLFVIAHGNKVNNGQYSRMFHRHECVTSSSVGSFEDISNSIEPLTYIISQMGYTEFTIDINNSFFSFEPNFYNNTYFVYAYKYDFLNSSWSSKTMNIIDELEINNKIYKDVIELEIDTIASGNYIWKLYLAKNHGIIKFCDRTTKSSFIIQD